MVEKLNSITNSIFITLCIIRENVGHESCELS